MRSFAIIIPAILILLAYSTVTYQRNVIWGDPEMLGLDMIKKSPGKGRVYYNLGNYYASQGRIDEAIALFETAIRVRPTSQEYNNLGLAYESKGLIDAAIDMFRRAIFLDASNAEAYNNLGKAYLLYEGRIDESISLFTKALELNATYADASLNLAAAHIQGRRFSAAVRILEALITHNAGRFDAHYNLGIAYHCAGDSRGAQRELTILRGADPSLTVRLEKLISSPCDNK
jgi:tetratricopeptide (TPR) repeat protein